MFDCQGFRKYLNANERRSYFDAIQNETETNRKAFLLTLFHTGCRISEALNLTVGRVDLSQKGIVFQTLKQRQDDVYRGIPVPDELISLLAETIAKANSKERVWKFSRSTGYRMVKAYMKQAGIRGIMACPKGIRHGFGVACVSKVIPLTAIQKWMGHARMETTAIYLEVSGEEERNLARRLWKS